MMHTMLKEEIDEAVRKETQRAVRLHPAWPRCPIHGAAIVCEEAGEAIRAALRLVYEGGTVDELRRELIETAATCYRMLWQLEDDESCEPTNTKPDSQPDLL